MVVLYEDAITGSMMDPSGASAKASRWVADLLLKEAERGSPVEGAFRALRMRV